MRNFTLLLSVMLISTLVSLVNLSAAVVDTVIITQVDTFALKNMPAQPVIKINIKLSGTGSLALQKLVINTANENNSDVDSVAVYSTTVYNRFSKADYPTEYYLLGEEKKIIFGDSVVFDNLSYIIYPGDNYFWVTMDLSQYSRVSRTLDAYIKAGAIKVGGNYYPASNKNPNDVVAIADIYFRENFENKTFQNEPVGWTQEPILLSPVRWKNNYGGYGLNEGPGHPSNPKSGNWNVMLYRESFDLYKTILISPKIDLSLSTKPLINFYHAQVERYINAGNLKFDKLRVLYKIGTAGSWNELAAYQNLPTPNSWLKREVYFPDGLNSSDVYLGFEGTTNYGWGVCVDSLIIYETEVINREVNAVYAMNKVLDMVPQGADQNPIIRVNIRIKGNVGTVNLNSIRFTSGNTSDDDIKSNGVKLFYTNDSVFLAPMQWGTSKSFVGGTVTFDNLNKVLETGNNYLWLTYDVKSNALPGHILDASVQANDISVTIAGTGSSYPNATLDPSGSRIIKQTLFFDDFEGTPAWNLTGEFEIAVPLGLGGLDNGVPDPTTAYSGSKVLGTDLSGLGSRHGDYEINIATANSYKATSPLIDGKYFKNTQFQFYRYLNVDNTDTAWIEYKLENSAEWVPLWYNDRKYIDAEWQKRTFSNLTFLDRKKYNLRFRLGSSDAIDCYSGWNIDYLFFTADSIPFDAAVTGYKSPFSSCGLTSGEHITVYIKNTGPKTLYNTPIKLSLDGGVTYPVTEIISTPIVVDDSIEYTFTTATNLSKSAIYDLVVKVAHPGDNYNDNDSIIQKVISFPKHNLPFSTDFEEDTTFWFAGGTNSSWFEGSPSGIEIFEPFNGYKCWKTDESGFHNINEFSYAESPCFSFTGTELPIIDFKFNHYTVPSQDGCILEYSLDEGQTWAYVPKDNYSFPWNWYNDTVTLLQKRGWSGRSLDLEGNQVWKLGRVILPSATANQNSVKFRFLFKSGSSRNEGFAFDDLNVYDAPHDIGVTALNGFANPSCQYENSSYLNVTVKNFGHRKMDAGDKVLIGVKVNGVFQISDTLTLTSQLVKDATVNYTLKYPVDFSIPGSNIMKVFTMNEVDNSFYATNNDTTTIPYTINPNPVTGFPDSIHTARPDTVVLQANIDPQYSYLWQGGSTNSYLAISNPGKYKITVTNIVTGCVTNDSVFVKVLSADVGVAEIISPMDHCGYLAPMRPIIKIENYGTDTLRANRQIPIKIKFNSLPVINDVITLNKILAPDSTITVTLNQTIDLSAPGIDTLNIYTQLPFDTAIINDPEIAIINIWGYPTLNLGSSTIVVRDSSYQFVAPAGYNAYLWSNGDTTNTSTVKTSGWHKLTVTDSHLCPAVDSAYVFLKIRDIKHQRIVSPVSACENDSSSVVTIKLFNAGTDTIRTNDTIYLSYQLNGGIIVPDTLVPSTQILPGDSVSFTFDSTVNIAPVNTYKLKVSVLSKPETDIRPENDTITYTVRTFGYPTPNLGADRSVTALQYTIDPGNYVSYLWQDGSTDSTYVITKTHIDPINRYQVTVTDVNGCTASSKATYIVLIIYDLTPSNIVLPSTICSLSSDYQLKVDISNVGNSVVTKDKIVKLKYTVNGGPFSKEDTLLLANNFNQNQTLNHTFKQRVDLSVSNDYVIKVYIDYDADVNLANDTLSRSISVYGAPVVDLGAPNDTLFVDFPYTLDAGPGFNSYLWSTGSTQQTISVSAGGLYDVRVTDTNNCIGYADVRIIEKIFDLGISATNLPNNACTMTDTTTVSLLVINNGTMTLDGANITLRYQIGDSVDRSQNFAFSGKPGTSRWFTFLEKANLSAHVAHQFNFTLTYTDDEVSGNNSYTKNVIVLGNPTPRFDGQENDTVKVAGFPRVLNAGAGYISYLWHDGSTNQTFSALDEGYVSVTVTNTYSCVGSVTVFVKNTISVRELDDIARVEISPNPAYDVLRVKINLKKHDKVTLEMVAIDGKVTTNRTLSGFMNYDEVLDVKGLAKGLYLIRIYAKDWLITDKVIVQ
jgi:hypothetical protein